MTVQSADIGYDGILPAANRLCTMTGKLGVRFGGLALDISGTVIKARPQGKSIERQVNSGNSIWQE